MRLFSGDRGPAVSEEAEPLPGKFVVVEESIGRFVLYPADAVRQVGPGKQGDCHRCPGRCLTVVSRT